METFGTEACLRMTAGMKVMRPIMTTIYNHEEKTMKKLMSVIALAALLLGGARFFILDEPTTGLDTDNRRILYRKIDDLCAKGVGFAVASHDRELIDRWPRRLHLQEGRVVDED